MVAHRWRAHLRRGGATAERSPAAQRSNGDRGMVIL
jgi:hypothetical protein